MAIVRMEPLEMKFSVILVILIGLKQANAINCYSCGLLESACNDPFKTSGAPTVTCSGSCYKVKAKDSSSNAQAAMRGCVPLLTPEENCLDSTYSGVNGTVCYCKGNLCNYTLPIGSSIIVMAAAMVIYTALQ